MKVFLGGIVTETTTFSPIPTGFEDYEVIRDLKAAAQGSALAAFADEAAGALDDFPVDVQWALFPEGAFIHVDGGTLELGLVRDSTLNSTNDFQFFGESFENVALLAPAQAALWVTSTVCPSGEFPATTTALSCS
jgi:hypothetical protein